ncbi:MAG: UDP-N-acetylmuramate--L-alanine ligase, partial [Saprospiraceae bacterium]|nr:UDP-N-acetylmuramate--L-alanine ligase [Saprospiraceae bacterium]
AARELFPGRKLTGIFQPHLYSRTRDFLTEFAAALDRLDEPVLLEIYPAREEPIPGIDSAALLKEMKNPNKRLWQLAELPDALGRLELDVLLTMGAGNIDTLVEPIQNWLQRTKP